jgi:hypothetical protein
LFSHIGDKVLTETRLDKRNPRPRQAVLSPAPSSLAAAGVRGRRRGRSFFSRDAGVVHGGSPDDDVGLVEASGGGGGRWWCGAVAVRRLLQYPADDGG